MCTVCKHEWFVENRRSKYYTGKMLQCEGAGCGHWYHQQCHEPKVKSVPGRGKKWLCRGCKPAAPKKSKRTQVDQAVASPIQRDRAVPRRAAATNADSQRVACQLQQSLIRIAENRTRVDRLEQEYHQPNIVAPDEVDSATESEGTDVAEAEANARAEAVRRLRPSFQHSTESLYKCMHCDQMKAIELLKKDGMENLSCIEGCQSSRRSRKR